MKSKIITHENLPSDCLRPQVTLSRVVYWLSVLVFLISPVLCAIINLPCGQQMQNLSGESYSVYYMYSRMCIMYSCGYSTVHRTRTVLSLIPYSQHEQMFSFDHWAEAVHDKRLQNKSQPRVVLFLKAAFCRRLCSLYSSVMGEIKLE